MSNSVIDRIEAVLNASYNSDDEKRKALAAARAAEFSGVITPRSITRGIFRLDILQGKASLGLIEIYARVFRKGVQLGFGPDGTVDVERFVIVNPPLLVLDPNGDISKPVVDRITGKVTQVKYRVDIVESLISVLTDMIRTTAKPGGNIIPGKEGRTTFTIYSDAADGDIGSTDLSGSYSDARTGANLGAGSSATYALVGQLNAGSVYICGEGFFAFDTSVLSGYTVNTATLACYGQNDSSDTDFVIHARMKTWMSSLTSGDWVAGGSLTGLTQVATFNTSGFSTSGYNTFTNVAFPANINLTGFTEILLHSSRHSGNNTPTGNEYVQIYTSDQTGTTNDPKLTIDATASASAIPVFDWHYRQQGIM